jgi:ParB family chromosome partitioning protein
MLVDIEKIKVSDRIRKDFGNIQELAEDIQANGLINPPVVTPEYELIAGERRLRAMKQLGYKQVEVRVMTVKDALHQLKLEISENENRKDFSFNEKMSWAKMLEEEYKKIARANMSDGGKGRQISDNLRTDDAVSAEVGFGSRDTYRKAQYISENAADEMISQLDDGKLSINAAYKKLKAEKEDAERRLQEKDNVIAGYKAKLENRVNSANNEEIQRLKLQVDIQNKKLASYEEQKKALENRAKLTQEDAAKYQKLKSDIEFLTKQKDDIGRKINSATELAGLTVEVQNLLENKLAPVKFKRCMDVLDSSDVAVQNLTEIIEKLDSWIREMSAMLPNNNVFVVDNYN